MARVRKIAHASSGEQQKPPHVSASELQEWQPHGDRHAWQHKSLTNAVEELDASGQPITSLAAAVEVIARVPLDNARAIQRWVTYLACLPWEDGCRHWPLATLPATLPRCLPRCHTACPHRRAIRCHFRARSQLAVHVVGWFRWLAEWFADDWLLAVGSLHVCMCIILACVRACVQGQESIPVRSREAGGRSDPGACRGFS